MRLDDWRNLPAEAMAPVYEAERERWSHGLQWDLAPTVQVLEDARSAGTLAGLVVRGPGQSVMGWTYFLVQDGVLQVGALHARTADGVRLLLDALFKAPEASLAQEILLFVYPDSPAIESALQRRRFDVSRYWYLRRVLDASCAKPVADGLRTWRASDGPDVVRLLARAYADVPSARCFAPHGRLDEWATYLGHLTRGTAVGRFLEEASLIAPGTVANRIAGAAVVSALSATTLHLAQLAVDPLVRRQGVGQALLDGMLSWGVSHRYQVATLLVSEGNPAARALYERRGFMPTGYFLHATRPLGRRVAAPPIAVSA